jgi:hypothetical protein
MTPAAFSGTYSDLKLVKTRSVAVVHIEIPIEQAAAFVAVFGMPLPGSERPVALALLKASPGSTRESAAPYTGDTAGGEPANDRTPWTKLPRAKRAGILCNDPRFQTWATDRMEIEIKPESWPGEPKESAAMYIRWRCGVKSRSDLDDTDAIATRFDLMESLYRVETGQLAEVRG